MNTDSDVDDLLDDAEAKPKKSKAKATAAPVKKAKAAAAPAKKAAAAPAKKAAAAPAKKAAAAPAKKAKAKAEPAERAPSDSPIRKALLKVKKAVSYADFAEANDFNIRTVRRMARQMRDEGEIDLSRDGQTVYISAAV